MALKIFWELTSKASGIKEQLLSDYISFTRLKYKNKGAISVSW